MPHNGKLGLLYRNKQWMSDFTLYTTTYKHKQKQTQHIPRTAFVVAFFHCFASAHLWGPMGIVGCNVSVGAGANVIGTCPPT